MPLQDSHTFSEVTITGFSSTAGTPGGVTTSPLPVPARGQVIKIGLAPTTSVTSTMTIAMLINNVAAVTSTSVGGAIATGTSAFVAPPSPVFVNEGDGIQFVFSGGNTSTIGATIFATIRK